MSTFANSIDLTFDIKAERRRRLRRVLKVLVPIATLLILLAAIAAIGIYLFQANQDDARELTDDLLAELEQRIVAEVVTFLQPASVMVRLAEEVLEDKALNARREDLAESLTMHILSTNPQLATLSFADPQGNFLMLKKWPDGSIHTKYMDRRGEGLVTRWTRRDVDGRTLGVEHDPSDTYDPRTRPWYQGAAATGKLYWSDVYVFFTDRRPGITASLPVFDAGGALAAVYSIDIALEKLSSFLASLEIGRSGRAMIVDDDGVLVAYPVMEQMVRNDGDSLTRAHMEDLADPVLNRAFDELRVNGPGKRELVVDGRRYINTATSLAPVLGRDWTLLIVAPEGDFVGFVAENNRRGLYMSVTVLALASLLAGLLVVQGLRADRNAALVFQRQRQLEAQGRAFSDLASQAALFDASDESAVAALTETVAQTVGTRRISIWRLTGFGRRLVCEDAYDRETGGHTAGMELTVDEIPGMFEALGRTQEVMAMDAAADPRTAELYRIYLHPMGCRALVSLPIVRGGQSLGAVWLEDDSSTLDDGTGDVGFARAIANLLALRMRDEAGDGEPAEDRIRRPSPREPKPLEDAMRHTALAIGDRGEAFLSRIPGELGASAAIRAQTFDDVSVVVMQFTDPITLATPIDGVQHTAAADLVNKLESLAAEHAVEYLKLLGNQIVCAAGFSGDPLGSAQLMADFALDGLNHCARLFSRLEQPLGVQIGMDSGPVIGSPVGRDQSIFNVWGEAVATASRMAGTGVPGQIQATESTYGHIRDGFLFRVRGSYYLEAFGEFTTYTLTGRL